MADKKLPGERTKMNHDVRLFLRDEPEGHGTLFLSFLDDLKDPDGLEALAIIGKDAMEADDCKTELTALIKEHAERIAETMHDIGGVEQDDS